jgi:hypothetical protein
VERADAFEFGDGGGRVAGLGEAGIGIRSDDGEYLTPSLFVNRHTTGRNAWRFVWLRFPGDDYWIRADNCRTSASKKLRRHAISDSTVDTSEPL